jgi:aromatic ring-opening dioxygenase catalytic subunit (LigB family)
MEEEKEMPEQDSPDEDRGFLVDHSTHDRCRDPLQELGEEAKAETEAEAGAELMAIQHLVDKKGIGLIRSEQVTKYDHQRNWRQEDIDALLRKFSDWISDDIVTEMAPIYRLEPVSSGMHSNNPANGNRWQMLPLS